MKTGPAVIFPNGGREWWKDDECVATEGIPKAKVSSEEFLPIAKRPCAERREEAAETRRQEAERGLPLDGPAIAPEQPEPLAAGPGMS